MPSRTSFCNRADWRSDWTRYAPLPALYTVFMVAIMLLTIGSCDNDYYMAASMQDVVRYLALPQMGYAMITARCLFGYLFDSRLCSAIHALPQTRGSRFHTHVLAGILFAMIPLLLVAALIAGVLAPGYPAITLVWLATAVAQYLFFFGFAVLAALFAGNRAGCLLIYAIGIVLPLLLPWVAGDILQPLFYGVTFSTDSFYSIWPLWIFCNSEYLSITYEYPAGDYANPVLLSASPDWQTMVILGVCAAFGAVLLVLADITYRRRALENSGELLAVQWLRPVFLVLFTVIFAAGAQIAASLFSTTGTGYGYLFAGLVIGFYVGLMLLKRQVNVFRLRTVPAVAGICAVFLVALLLTGADVAETIRYIPDPSEIQSATIAQYYTDGDCGVTTDDPADIQSILTVHTQQVERWKTWRQENNSLLGLLTRPTTSNVSGAIDSNTLRMSLQYTLRNGRTVTRDYYIDADSSSGQIAKEFLTRPENVLGVSNREELKTINSGRVEISCYTGDQDSGTVDDAAGLLEAIYNDCLEKKILPAYFVNEQDTLVYGIYLQNGGLWIPIYANGSETEAFLREHTVPIPDNFYEETALVG